MSYLTDTGTIAGRLAAWWVQFCGIRPLLLVVLPVVLLLGVPVVAPADDPSEELPPPAVEAEDLGIEERTEDEGLRAPIDDWRDTLRFGIDSEVISLLETLTEQREGRLHEEIAELYDFSPNPRLRRRILEFFTELQYGGAEELALQVLREPREHSNELVLAAVRYVAAVVEEPMSETLASLHEIADSAQPMLADTAMRAIGRRGGQDDIEPLMQRLTDRRTPTALRGSVILALGELRAADAVEELIRIVGATAEDATVRRYAADSLGRIGDPRAIEPLSALLRSEDTMLRAYVVNGLGHFEGAEVERALTAALRDSYWRVRVAALQGIARHGMHGAVPAVVFRAERDPETPVRNEALLTLARLDSRETRKFLSEYVQNSRIPEASRIVALRHMLEQNTGAYVDVVEALIEAEYDKSNSGTLDQIGRVLSTSEQRVPDAVYERLLDHPNFVIKIYGLRAIGRHNVRSLSDRLREMAEEGNHQAVRRTAVDALNRIQ